MIPQTALATIAKFVAVGGLMAAGAGGVYLVASTRGDDSSKQAIIAATATPTAAATATAAPANTFAFPATASLPSPSSQSEAMVLGGDLWVDARPALGEVLAFIGGLQCGRGQSVRLQSEPPNPIPSFFIEIASDAAQPGFGVPGAAITISINGRAMNNAIEWQPGFQQPVSLISGPAFASYYGTLQLGSSPPPFKVLPYVSGIPCGTNLSPMVGIGGEVAYHVVVDPEELHPGCGRAGATITLLLQADGQSDIVLGAAQWMTGSAVQVSNVDLSSRFPVTPSPSPGAVQ